MAKHVTTVPGTIDELRSFLEHNAPRLGFTISLEEEIPGSVDGIKYLICTYERYAVLGENRVSLNVTMMEYSEGVRVVATASGGSQAAFFKINTWSEGNFLDDFVSVIDAYKSKREA